MVAVATEPVHQMERKNTVDKFSIKNSVEQKSCLNLDELESAQPAGI